MEFYKPEKQPRLFPEWVKDSQYLPTMDDLKALKQQGLWDDFIHHNPKGSEFQILTKEYISSLSDFLVEQIEKLPKDSITVLEVGAGNGRLTHFLQESINKKIKGKKVIFKAVDDFSWDGKVGGGLGSPFFIKKLFDVEIMSVEEAIKHNPDVVISSWMPKDIDWTKNFRDSSSVQMFVLIGAVEDCGTQASWSSDEKFQGVEIDVKGNVCWSDITPSHSRSRTGAFIRQEQ